MRERCIVRRVKTLIFATSVLVATVMLIALIIGTTFYIYSVYIGNTIEVEVSRRFLAIVIAILIPSTLIAVKLKEYTVTEIVDAFIVVTIYWLLMPIINAVIYYYTIGLNLIDSLFESLSGFTGTGLTVISKPEELPYTILVWRAATQWIGELGVVVFSGALLPHVHRFLSRVYIAERGVRFTPTVLSTTRRMLSVYIVITVLGVAMFMYSGMGFLDAIAHSMTAIATGGMSTNSQNIGFWYKAYGGTILVTSSMVMVLGALNFADLYNLLRGNIRRFIKGLEVRWFLYVLALLGSIAAILSFVEFKGDFKCVAVALYHVVSGITTTGFQAENINNYSDILKFTIILGMIIGGATFSTAGGVKIRRIIIMFKSVIWSISRPFLPERVYIARRIDGEAVEEGDILSVYGFIALYTAVAIVSSAMLYIVLNTQDYNWSRSYIDALFETISALSCVGLSVGITSTHMPLGAKLVLMANMYLGRLEFLPIYLTIGYLYRSRVTL